MPIAGKGMLLTSMNIEPSEEPEFNRWYDREHLEERVAMPGFLEARRYVAVDGNPKYLSLYSTETFEVLDSPAYRTALANQIDAVWHRHLRSDANGRQKVPAIDPSCPTGIVQIALGRRYRGYSTNCLFDELLRLSAPRLPPRFLQYRIDKPQDRGLFSLQI